MNSSMNSSSVKFLTIKEAAAVTGKSESTLKRFVREVKQKQPKKYNDNKCFKFDKLPTGHKKVLVSETFLSTTYPIINSSNINDSNEPLNSVDNQEFLEHLKSEIILKNEQLSAKDKQIEALLDRNKEINLLFAQAQKREQLKIEESIPRKRWWQKKKAR